MAVLAGVKPVGEDRNPADAAVSQGLHSVAFTGGLSKPLVAPPGVAARLTPPVLADFIASNYGAQRMVLAGAHAGALIPTLAATLTLTHPDPDPSPNPQRLDDVSSTVWLQAVLHRQPLKPGFGSATQLACTMHRRAAFYAVLWRSSGFGCASCTHPNIAATVALEHVEKSRRGHQSRRAGEPGEAAAGVRARDVHVQPTRLKIHRRRLQNPGARPAGAAA